MRLWRHSTARIDAPAIVAARPVIRQSSAPKPVIPATLTVGVLPNCMEKFDELLSVRIMLKELNDSRHDRYPL